MTLLMVIPTRDGMLVAADKRGSDPERGVKDDENKLWRLAPNVAFAGAGALRHPARMVGGQDAFNLWQTIHAYVGGSDVSTDDEAFWKGAEKALLDSYMVALGKLRPANPRPNLPWISSFFIIASEEKVTLRALRLFYEPDANVRVEAPSITLEPPLLADGDVTIITEIMTGNDPPFDKIREEPIGRFLTRGKDEPPAATEEVMEHAKRLFVLTNECSKARPYGDQSTVSSIADFALLRPGAGFEWLQRVALSGSQDGASTEITTPASFR